MRAGTVNLLLTVRASRAEDRFLLGTVWVAVLLWGGFLIAIWGIIQ